MMLDSLDAKRRRNVGFPRARPADQDDVVAAVDKLAPVQLADQPR